MNPAPTIKEPQNLKNLLNHSQDKVMKIPEQTRNLYTKYIKVANLPPVVIFGRAYLLGYQRAVSELVLNPGADIRADIEALPDEPVL